MFPAAVIFVYQIIKYTMFTMFPIQDRKPISIFRSSLLKEFQVVIKALSLWVQWQCTLLSILYHLLLSILYHLLLSIIIFKLTYYLLFLLLYLVLSVIIYYYLCYIICYYLLLSIII